ncbi:hypothetical protein [Novosphingobium sp.]|uniref:hypothetical protein n=1 Tax=Novosphingobium sp. TaxID=1874826 RepID=UPI00260E3BA7|nr:hypothetical protein [Novosphingobium sp.]
MRSTGDNTSVRLYHLDDGPEGGAAHTLFYGPLAEALALAAQQPEDLQEGLYIATDNDVALYLDLVDP